MGWNEKQIRDHKIASRMLYQIMQDSFEYIRKNKNITEYHIREFILKEFKENGLKMDRKHPAPIVAFNKNSAFPHYVPQKISKKLKPNTFILIDIWAKLDKKKSPFSDITWLAYYGRKIPQEVAHIFRKTIGARDLTINFIKTQLKKRVIPIGSEIDIKVANFIYKAAGKETILHRTGHSIGTLSPHGVTGHLSLKNKDRLEKNLGYTIEPGIYLKNKFGMRSEINFYIDENLKMHITTKIQKKLVLIY